MTAKLSQKRNKMYQQILGISFLILTFLHGVFASGFIPILNEVLETRATFAFSLYFAGILLGQLAIYKFYFLSKSKKSFPVYEVFFGFSLVYMALFLNGPGLISGRFLEGLAAGLTMPLLFASLVKLAVFGTVGKRVTLFNSVFALGFVLGPFIVSAFTGLFPVKACLLLFGFLFIIAGIFLLFLDFPDISVLDKGSLSLRDIMARTDKFEKFYTLFLAKTFYGFLLAFTTAYLTGFLPNLSLTVIMLIFSVIFILGQVFTEKAVERVPKEHFEVYAPLILAISLLLFFTLENPYFFFVSAFLHSTLAFTGYLNFGLKAVSAREFALFNSITDPAMILGSFLASFGIFGVWGLIILTPLPLLHFLLQPHNRIRAEKFFPFVGPLTIFKIFKKHASPLVLHPDNEIRTSSPALSFEPFNTGTDGKTLSFIFTGDFCPVNGLIRMSAEMQAFIKGHDMRVLNLEGLITGKSTLKSEHLHEISQEQMHEIICPSGVTVFNLVSFVNNHVLDKGQKAFNQTIDYFSTLPGTDIFTSGLFIKEIKGIKTGFFGLTFGINLFWRTDKKLSSLKPEEIINNEKKSNEITALIRSLKQQVDLLVLSYHWGYESEYLPSEVQKKCFEILSDAGVDILYGHHSHIAQPYETLENTKLCLYSCGNFISDMPHEVYSQGVLYSVEFLLAGKNLKIKKVKPCFFVPEKNTLVFSKPESVNSYRIWKEKYR